MQSFNIGSESKIVPFISVAPLRRGFLLSQSVEADEQTSLLWQHRYPFCKLVAVFNIGQKAFFIFSSACFVKIRLPHNRDDAVGR